MTMRSAFLAALTLAAMPLAAASAADPSAPAGARVLGCRQSPLLDQRVAVVGTTMRPLPAGRRLLVRIDLWQRLAGGRWTQRTDVPGLGAWTAPSDPLLGTRPGDVFKYRQAVGRLLVPASYRFRVAFRWLDPDGAVVREKTVQTPVCKQPDVRPDLTLAAVQATPSPRADGLVRYAVTVRNDGRSAATHAVVAATLPGDATPELHLRTVARLDPGQSATVAFTGPGCAAGELPAVFVADPSNAVDESRETNNELDATCPAPQAGVATLDRR